MHYFNIKTNFGWEKFTIAANEMSPKAFTILLDCWDKGGVEYTHEYISCC
jgi:hypothetical protein